MKIVSKAFFLLLVTGLLAVRAEEKKSPKTDVQPVQTEDTSAKNSTQLQMKIQTGEEEEVRHQAFLEELRKLYKANFL